MSYYLAIDIGASGGRHILGHIEEGKLVTEEIYRFTNSAINHEGHLVWDIDLLLENVLLGLIQCKKKGRIPVAVGIDTWGVDFVLLDAVGNRIGEVFSYRDNRTDGMEEAVNEIISFKTLYQKTGIQKQPFNTIYQLMSLKKKCPEILEKAEHMLMIPDYLEYRLTGMMAQEYTNATTTGLVNAIDRNWDFDIIDKLGFPRRIFEKILLPGSYLGNLSKDIVERIGYDTKIFVSASHDTASAIVAIPAETENILYISSGTWSLMGTECKEPICGQEALESNLTNEGGYDYRYRFLKNIMGLWMIQSVRKELCPNMEYQKISKEAASARINSVVDVNDGRFLSPRSMVEEINDYLKETRQQVPSDIGEYARVIYRSLAICYQRTIEEIEKITGLSFQMLNIVGGGSMSDFLNQETANLMKRTVLAGPTEGTAIGNLMVTLIANDEIDSLAEGRKIIKNSTQIIKYEPQRS